MNREIEFMAFDEQKKIWHHNFQFIKSGDKGNDWIVFTSDKQKLSDDPHPLENPYFSQQLKIYQYTGLKDKNGEKIFEGALLRYPPKDQWEEDNYVVFEVFFHDNDHADNHIGWQFNRLHFHGSIAGYSKVEKFLPKYVTKMICIGHIATNPELIER